MNYTRTIDNCSGLPTILGRTIQAIYIDYGSAALKFTDGDVVCFVTDEVVIGKWFEVYPIQMSTEVHHEIQWTALKKPFAITRCDRLWREEWQESVADEDENVLGSAPHCAQFAMPLGSAPATADHLVKVCAGVRLSSADGQVLVICSSSANPFGMDVAMNSTDCDALLKEHTVLD